MTQTDISFVISNATDNDALAVILPAPILKGKTLEGKFLAVGSFLDATGTVTLTATEKTPAGGIADLLEYAQNVPDLQVIGASIGSDSQSQARQSFIARTHLLAQAATDAVLADTIQFGHTPDSVQHTLMVPFSNPRKNASLLLPIKAHQTVAVTLSVCTPSLELTDPMAARAAVPVINGAYQY